MSLRPLSRRTLLRGAGSLVALPLLDAMAPSRLSASSPAPARPRRLVCIFQPLGVCNESWYPSDAGANFALSPTLEPLRELRDQVSLVSGLHHPQVPENHAHVGGWLSAVNHYRQPAISVDQLVAERYGRLTRYPSLQLGFGDGSVSLRSGLSWTRDGLGLPATPAPDVIYTRLFTEGDPSSRAQAILRLQQRRSVLDGVLAEARSLQATVGAEDRDRLDRYFFSVREAETALAQSERFIDTPVPRVQREPVDPTFQEPALQTRSFYDLMYLALSTDQTRIITWSQLTGAYPHLGPDNLHHGLSHHGGDVAKLQKMAVVDRWFVSELGRFMTRLRDSRDAHGSLLDSTAILYGAGLNNGTGFQNGNGSHACKNIALMVAGGRGLGLRHSQHIVHTGNRTPASNLLFTLQQAMDVPGNAFADSTGTVSGLI